ncbi:MAG: SCO family protein [Elusimicrobia bacterium]|nr:SCO family protein [Elusimicrobiota bacterium]
MNQTGVGTEHRKAKPLGPRLAVWLASMAVAAAALILAYRSESKSSLPYLGALPSFEAMAAMPDGGEPFKSQEFLGRPWIAGFIFTHCGGPCPMLTANMAKLQKKLPGDVRLATFTVDPQRDTTDAMREYARRFGADLKRWRFLRMERNNLYPLLADGFKLSISEDASAPSGLRISHSAKLVLVDGAGSIRGYYDGEDAQALKKLAKEAAGLLNKSDK